MSETQGKKSWFKTAIGAVAGLCSGAVIMYLTPLVNQVVKGETPLANFEARSDGLNVTFHNLSAGPKSLEGWWDFGDGSPLTPLTADQDVRHTYTRAGSYTAKLTVRTLLGEASDRSVTLQLDAGTAEPPRIVALDARPVTPGAQAPATFVIGTEVKNAEFAVWDLDQGRPLEVNPASPGRVERLVTFEKPGAYQIKLAAFNGQQHEEKLLPINVRPAPAGCLTAVLSVNDQATQVERHERRLSVSIFFPAGQKGNSYSFKHDVSAADGLKIVDAKASASQGSGQVRNLRLERDPSGKKVHVTGELMRNSAKELPALMLPVVLKEERRKGATRVALPVMAPLTCPGTAQLMLPPLPAGWESPKRQLKLELRDGQRVVWQDGRLPGRVALNLRNHRCVLTAVQTGDHIQLSLNEQ